MNGRGDREALRLAELKVDGAWDRLRRAQRANDEAEVEYEAAKRERDRLFNALAAGAPADGGGDRG